MPSVRSFLEIEITASSVESFIRGIAFCILLLLCLSPLLATFSLLHELSITKGMSSPRTVISHREFNYYLGLVAFFFLIAWSVLQFRMKGFSVLKCLLEERWMVVFIIFILWITLTSLISSDDLFLTVVGDSARHEGTLALLSYAGFAFAALLINNELRRSVLLWAFVAISAVLGAFYIAQIARIGALASLTGQGFCVFFANTNHHAYYVMLGIVASAGLFYHEALPAVRVAAIANIVLLSVCLVINSSFGPFLAGAFALVFLVIITLLKDGKTSLIMLVPLVAFSCVAAANVAGIDYKGAIADLTAPPTPIESSADNGNADDSQQPQTPASPNNVPSTTSSNFSSLAHDIQLIASGSAEVASVGSMRGTLYIAAVDLITESPVFGYGMEHGGWLLRKRARTIADRAHNEVLQWGLYGGIPAMTLYVLGMALLAIRQLRLLHRLDSVAVASIGCTAAYLASSLLGCMLFSVTPYLWMFIGLSAWLPKPDSEQN